MSDLISREAVLESLKTDYSLIMLDSYGNLTFAGERIIEAIKRVPSVEPERKKGKWIVRRTEIHIFTYCSNCGADGELTWHYCRHCGAKMEDYDEID